MKKSKRREWNFDIYVPASRQKREEAPTRCGGIAAYCADSSIIHGN